MKERRRVFTLVMIMTIISLVVGGIAIYLLYNTAIKEERARLVETAQSRARLIEAIARFNAVYSTDYPEGAEAATLSQIIEAHRQFEGFGRTGEFVLAKHEGNSIVFLLNQRHSGLSHPQPISFSSKLAEPMRRALTGQSGSVVDLDYRGEVVLAAYEPVAVLDMGIVAKIDMAEIRSPFIRAGFIAAGAAATVITLGSVLFLRVGNPIIRRLQEYSEHLEERVEERTKELRESEERYRAMVDLGATFGEAIVMIQDTDEGTGTIIFANDGWSHITGYPNEELIGTSYFNLIHPKHREGAMDRYRKGIKGKANTTMFELSIIRKDGTEITTEAIGATTRYKGRPAMVGYYRDVTERRQLEEYLAGQKRLALLGQLAGGLGHELRNPLGAIKNAAYFLKMTLEKPQPEVRETIKIVEKEVAASEHIISSLLGYARPRPPTLSKTAINDLLKKTLAKAHIPDNIKVAYELEEGLPDIPADPNQLGQVFSNIVLNAVQAMPEGGKLTVKSEKEESKQVSVSFTDSGAGIPKKELAKVFEPLFTTKAKGIGLGLAVTKTIVEGHGGTIRAHNTGRKGAIFTVKLSMNERKE